MDHLPPLTEDRGPMFLKANWVGVGFGVIFVAARIFTRMGLLSLDDYFMVISLVCGQESPSDSATRLTVSAGFWNRRCGSQHCSK